MLFYRMNHPLGARSRAAAVILLAWFCALQITARAEIIEQILVKVNGEIFTKTDLEARQVAALRQRGFQFDRNDQADSELRQALNAVTPQVLVDAVLEMLVVQRGRELGYRLTDDQFTSILNNIRKENKLDTEERFQAALRQERMTLADLRRQIERGVIASRVQQAEVLGKIGVTEDEAKRYYESHLEEFTTPASVTLREILVSVPSDGKSLNVGLDEEAKQKAEELHKRVLAGESFEKLSAEASDAPSRANSGLIGPISLVDLSPDLRKIIEPMRNGQITDVIRTPRGYQFFRVETLTESQTTPFEQARERVNDRIFDGKRQAEFDRYVARLRSQAIIEWKNADLKKAYEEGLVEYGKRAAQ
jgi:peptidyl-prolyl cis-trans isomerase SurA